MSRINLSCSCLSESSRNCSRVTSRCVHTAYNVVPDVIDVWDVRCETHTMSRSGALHVVTVEFFKADRKRLVWEASSPHASVIVCDVTHVWIDAVCVMSYMRFNTCVCICGHGCIGHTSTMPQSMSMECIASCSLASAIDGATSLWCTRGYIATTIYSVTATGVC